MSEGSGTVERTLAVLRVLAEADGPVGVKQVADALGLPRSTSHRLLDLLAEGGFVSKVLATRRYVVGEEFSRVAGLVASKSSVTAVAQTLLQRLTCETGETALFGMYLPADGMVMYAAKSDSVHALRYRIDLFKKTPLSWGSTGLAILAYLPEEVQAEIISRGDPSPIDGHSFDPAELSARMAEIRRLGYAVSRSEKLPDSVGIAAPFEAAPGLLVGSIAITIPQMRFDESLMAEYGRLICKVAAATSRNLSSFQ